MVDNRSNVRYAVWHIDMAPAGFLPKNLHISRELLVRGILCA